MYKLFTILLLGGSCNNASEFVLRGDLSDWIPVSVVEVAAVTIRCLDELRGFHDNGFLHEHPFTSRDFTYMGIPANLILEPKRPAVIETFTGIHYPRRPHSVATSKQIKFELLTVFQIVLAAIVRSRIPIPSEIELCNLRVRSGQLNHDDLMAVMRRLIPSRVPHGSSVDPSGLIDQYHGELTRTELELFAAGTELKFPHVLKSTDGAVYLRGGASARVLGWSRNRIEINRRTDFLAVNKERLILGHLATIDGVAKLVQLEPPNDRFVVVASRSTDMGMDEVDWSKLSEEFLVHFTIRVLTILRDIHNAGFVYGLIEANSFVFVNGRKSLDPRQVRMVDFGAASTWLDPGNLHTRAKDVIELLSFVFYANSECRMTQTHRVARSCWPKCVSVPDSKMLCQTINMLLDDFVVPDVEPQYDALITRLESILDISP